MDDAAALAMAQQGAAMAEEKLGELKTLLNDMRKDRDGVIRRRGGSTLD
jgi:hypothetical protein